MENILKRIEAKESLRPQREVVIGWHRTDEEIELNEKQFISHGWTPPKDSRRGKTGWNQYSIVMTVETLNKWTPTLKGDFEFHLVSWARDNR